MVAALRGITSFRLLVGMLAIVGLLVVVTAPSANAASLTDLSLTMDDTSPGATGVIHDFTFEVGTSGNIKAVKFEYCDSASGTCVAPTGLDASSAAIDTAGTVDAYDAWDVTADANTITASDSADVNATSTVSLAFDTITNVGATNDTEPTIFYVRVTTYSDEAASVVVDGPSVLASAVIPTISLTGTQDAILELTVDGVNNGVTVDDSKDTTATSTATTLPFGNFKALNTAGAESKALAHTINVVTNGSTGYTATVTGGANAMSRVGGGATISYIADDSEWDDDPETGDSGFGVAADGGDAPAAFDNDTDSVLEYFGIASAVTIASDSAPTSGQDTTVVYRVQVEATQAAGDYSGSIDYTVLPNF